MPSNPLTQEEINDYTINRILNPSGYTGLSPYMPQGYFLSTPSSGDGPALWRLFDASFISSGTISPDRLGSGSVGLGDLYLADDGTWKEISIPPTPTLDQVTTAGNVTTNSISTGKITATDTGLSGTTRPLNAVATGADTYVAVAALYAPNTNAAGRYAIFTYGTSSSTGNSAELRFYYAGSNNSGSRLEFAFNGYANPVLSATVGGNVLIGTTTNAGYKLDVNGSFRIQTGGANYLLVDTSSGYISTFNPVGDSYYRLGPSSSAAAIWFHNERIRFGDGGSSTNYKPIIAGAGSVFGNVSIAGGGNPLGLNTNEKINFSDRVQMGMVGTQYFRIGYVNADLGAKTIMTIYGGGNVGIGTTTPTAPLHVATSVTASAALAQGVYFNNTLVAAANNDVLVGLDINPTFTLGGLTGVSRVGARIQNGALLIGTTLLNTDTISFPLQINGSSQNIGSIFRNALSTGYTSFRFYNDRNSASTAMEMGYAGSAYPSAILTGGVTGESAYLTSTGAYPLQLGTNNTARFIIFSNGNIGINTATDAGYKLDVNGTVRVQGSLNISATAAFTIGTIQALARNTNDLMVGFDNSTLTFYTGNNPLARFYSNGNFSVGSIVNSGAKFQVTGSITAATALAQGVYFNNTLVAAANNDVLVGLDINPTFTNGAFTGVSNYAVRVTNTSVALFDSVLYSQAGPSTNNTTFSITGTTSSNYTVYSSRNFIFNTGQSMYFNTDTDGGGALERNWYFAGARSGTTGGRTYVAITTDSSGFPRLAIYNNDNGAKINLDSNAASYFNGGNVLIGTTTDSGYKLDVNGTLRVSGVASLTSIINQSTLVDGATFNADTNVITITGGRGNNSLGVLNISTTIGSFAPNFGGEKNMVNIGGNFTVGSSATGNVNFLAINPTINYPVGSSGIQRGIYLNPTLTRVTDYRAIEVVTGNVIFGSTSGSVGIGTTTPNYILDVYQTNVKAQIRSTGENQNATLFLGTPFGGTSSPKVAIIARAKTSWSRADLAFCLSDNQSSNSVEATISDLRMVILSDGKVGVNVANPTYQFQVSGDIALSGNLVPTAGSQTLGTFTNRFGDVWAGGLIVGSTFYGDNHQSASGTLYFKDGGGVEKMRMTSVGNFLIGTTTDTGEKLQVNGTVRASAFAIGATAGWTGTINIPTNPPGQQNIDVQGGIITNVS